MTYSGQIIDVRHEVFQSGRNHIILFPIRGANVFHSADGLPEKNDREFNIKPKLFFKTHTYFTGRLGALKTREHFKTPEPQCP